MTPIIWRQAVAGDADALACLGVATFLATFAFDHPGAGLIMHLKSQHSSEYYAEKLTRADTDILIGETPLGAPVGYVMLVPPEHPAFQREGDLELKRIYLLGPWQGGGHGREMMQRALDVAAKRGAKRLLLAVYESNPGAIGFYERAGFSKIGETIFMVGDVEFADFVYAKSMTG
jgi:ribosomal protein S18 acetylase RimI-like enzyme